MKNQRYIYADNAATTQISPEVLFAMMPWLTSNYGNPSSIYKMGREAHAAIDNARLQVANALGATKQEIYFTASGSESDNWAIKGVAHSLAKKGKKHLITSVFEHHAVIHSMQALEKEGFTITYLPVYENGIVKLEDIANAIQEDTALVSIMYANNEIGTIQPIAEIGELCRSKNIVFHTDAVQAVGNVEIDVVKQNIDLLSLSGHKIHAPKGIGALYIKKGTARFPNLIDGGGQESARRAGTENVASIIGLGRAIEIACSNIPEKAAKVILMRDKLINGILKLPHTRLNGDANNRLPGNVNISLEGIEGESLLLKLDEKGIACSSGSACTSGALDPSHVLLALGLIHEVAHGSLRLSINESFSMEDIDYILDVIPTVAVYLRNLSPLWEQILKEDKIQGGK